MAEPGLSALPAVSVLLPVYAGDRAPALDQALASLVAQTHPAEQVVVVEDGPLTDAVRMVLANYADRLPLHHVRLPANQGLGPALQAGLARCHNDLVARADADDVNRPERLARQAAVLSRRTELAALGGFGAEFVDDPDAPYSVRTVPVGIPATARYARRRSPMNHPTVMFRLAAVADVGGYDRFSGIEDYYLWAKLISAGYALDNLPEVLVALRAGSRLSGRRGGWRYARREIGLLRAFVQIGFMTRRQAALALIVRVPVRLVPVRGRDWIYRHLLRR